MKAPAIILTISILCSFFCVSAQHSFSKERYGIKISEYDYMFFPQRNSGEMITAHLLSGNTLKIHLLDLKGKMNIECYDKKSNLVEKGSYINSLALLSNYTYAIGIGRRSKEKDRTSIVVDRYYQPLRNGKWYFYDDTKKLYMEKNYKRGILVDSVKFR